MNPAPWTPTRRLALLCILILVACTDQPADPTSPAPSFHRDGGRDRTIVVDPKGRHDATTIQAGIDMAHAGGVVRVMAGTYAEVLVIDKGLTLEGTDRGDDDDHWGRGKHDGRVIIVPPGTPTIGVQITTPDPVTIRDLGVHFSGLNGIRGDGGVNLTIERVSVLAVNPPTGRGYMVSAVNDPGVGGIRARITVRASTLDGSIENFVPGTAGIAMMFGIVAQGDVDASFEGNQIRRTGGACVLVLTRADGAGATNANVLRNDLDLCHPTGRVASLIVGAPAALPASQLTVTGVVNLIGNVIRNSSLSCLPTDAIVYEFGSGVVEHNRILQGGQACATPSNRSLPGGIWIGSTRSIGGVRLPPASPAVRFNDIVGNVQAGLRIGPNQTTRLDARCNYWGSTSGPSGTGLGGTGDAIVVETGAARPAWAPFATRPVARHRGRGHDGDDDDDDRHGRAKCKLEFSASLSAAEEVPNTGSAATGNAIFLTVDGDSVRFRLRVANIQNVLQAHIHVGATGVNGPVVVFLYPAAPPAVLIPGPFNGTLGEGTFTAANLRGPLTGMQVSDLLAQMLAGNTYANVHTSQFTGGEIRGQIHQKVH